MSKKSRERRAKRNPNYVFPDDHMIIGKLEIERFGNKVLISNNSTPTEVTQRIQNLASNYQNNHDVIARELDEIREKICQCDPLSILLYFKSLVALYQLNMFSESEYSTEANAAIRAFEYIQAGTSVPPSLHTYITSS